MSALMLNKGTEDWHTLTLNNKPVGDVLLKSLFEPHATSGMVIRKVGSDNSALEKQADEA